MEDFCDSDLENGVIKSQQDRVSADTQNHLSSSPTFKTPSIRRQVKREPTALLNYEFASSISVTDVQDEDWIIPVLSSNQSSLLQHRDHIKSGTPRIPESLCTFLDTKNTSWSSSLASTTPQKSNVTYSDFNTEEKKVFIPIIKDEKKARALFTPDPDEQVLCKVLDSSFNESGDLDIILKNNNLNSSTLEDSYDHIFLLSDGSINTTVKNIHMENEELRARDCEPPLVKEVLDLLCSPVGSNKGRKKVDQKCSKSNGKLRQHDTPNSLTNNKMNSSSEDKNQEHSESHEFLNDISFGTLEEVCRVSEMVASSPAPLSSSNVVNTPSLNNHVEASKSTQKKEINKYDDSNLIFEPIPLSNTSTPIPDKHKHTFGETVLKKRKIKFVNNIERTSLNIFGHNESTIKVKKTLAHSHQTTETEVKCDINNISELQNIESNIFVRPLVSSLEKNSNEMKKFLYFKKENVTNGELVQRQAESVLKNILTSAKTLEIEMPLNLNSNLPSKLIKLKTNDTCGIQNFITFHRLQEAQDSTPDSVNVKIECDIGTDNCEKNLYFDSANKDRKSLSSSGKLTQDGFINKNKEILPTINRKRLMGEIFSECTELIPSECCVYNTTKKLKLKIAKQCGNEKQVDKRIYDGVNEENESFISLSTKQMTLNNLNSDMNGGNTKNTSVSQFEETDFCETQMLHELDKVEVIYNSNIQLQNMQVKDNINLSSNVTNDEKLRKLEPYHGNKSDLPGNNNNTNESLLETSCESKNLCSKKKNESQSNFDGIMDIPLPSNVLDNESSLQSYSGLLEELDSCNSGFLNSERLSPTLKSAYKKRKRSKSTQNKRKEKSKRIKHETQLILTNCDIKNNDKINEKRAYVQFDPCGKRDSSEKLTKPGKCITEKFKSKVKTDDFGMYVTSLIDQENQPAEITTADLTDPVLPLTSKGFISSNKVCLQDNLCDDTKTTDNFDNCVKEANDLKKSLLCKNCSAYDTDNTTIITASLSTKNNQTTRVNVINKPQSEEPNIRFIAEKPLFEGKVCTSRKSLQNLPLSLHESECLNLNNSNCEKDRSQNYVNSNSTIFNSASSKEISISDHSIFNACKFFDDIFTYDLKNIPKYFTTASGKKCEVSEKHLKEASVTLQSTLFPDNDDLLNCLNAFSQNDYTEPHLDDNKFSYISERKVKCSPSSSCQVSDIDHINLANIYKANGANCLMKTDGILSKECYTPKTKINTHTEETELKSEKSFIKKFETDAFPPKLLSLEDNLSLNLSESDNGNMFFTLPKMLPSVEKSHFYDTNKYSFNKDVSANPLTNINQFDKTGRRQMEVSSNSFIEHNTDFKNSLNKYEMLQTNESMKGEISDANSLDQTKEIKESVTEFKDYKIANSLKDDKFSNQGIYTVGGKLLEMPEKDTLEHVSDSAQCKSQFLLRQYFCLGKGFTTAAGRLLKVSENSLRKAKEILEDDGECGHSIEEPPISNKCINSAVDNEVLEQSLFEEKETLNDGSKYNECQSEHSSEQNKFEKGFTTASGRLFKESENSLKKAKEILEDVDVSTESNNSMKEASSLNKSFPSVRGKYVNVTEKSLVEATHILDNRDKFNECKSEQSLEQNLLLNQGFTDACGRLLMQSENSPKKAKRNIKDVKESCEYGNSIRELSVSNSRFSTAGGNESTIEAKEIIDDGGKFSEYLSEHFLKQNLPLNQGFTTAGGRQLKISNNALHKAKKILEDIDGSTQYKNSTEDQLCLNNCFSTAGGKDVIVLGKSLLEAKSILVDRDKFNERKSEHSLKQNLVLNQGFTDACERLLIQSENSPKEAKKIIEEVRESCEYGNPKRTLSVSNSRLSTAGGNESTIEAKEILDDGGKFSEYVSEPLLKQNLPLNQGFTTAGGRKVKVSDNALQKAKKILEDVDGSIECNNSTKDQLCLKNSFSTAGGKDVIVLGKSLIETKEILDNGGKFNEYVSEPLLKQNLPLNQGFTTAGGRKVKVSDNALQKAKKILEDVDGSTECNNSTKDQLCLKNSFSMAGGKDVIVLGKSVIETKEILDNGGKFSEYVSEPLLKQNLPLNQGFTTAGGRKVKVSDNALQKAKKILEDVDGSTECNNSTKDQLCLKNSFSMAGGKDVIVLGKSVIETKEILDNGGKFSEYVSEPLLKQNLPLNQGFTTAGGRKVKVSDNALQKAKKILEDVDGSTECKNSTEDQLCLNNCFSIAGGKDVNVTENFHSEAKHIHNKRDKFNECKSEHSFKQNQLSNQRFNIAGEKQLKASETSLKKAAEIVEDVAECGHQMKEQLFSIKDVDVSTECVNSMKEPSSLNNCIKSAGRKDVNVSEKSFIEAKPILDYTDKFNGCVSGQSFKQNHSLNQGFTTAGGKLVLVSENSLMKAKKILEGVDESSECKDSIKELSDLNKCFSSSGGEKKYILHTKRNFNEGGEFIRCQNEPLLKQNLLLNNDYDSAYERPRKVSENAHKKEFFEGVCDSNVYGNLTKELTSLNKCFTTAGGRNVNVSEKPLIETKQIFDENKFNDCLNEHSSEDNLLNQGFNTADGKQLELLEKTLKSAKNVLEDVGEYYEYGKSIRMPSVSNKCLTTAVGKESIIDAKEILDNGGKFSEYLSEHFLKQNLSLNQGFTTAGGRQLKVSDNALRKAKELLEDVDGSTEGNNSTKNELCLNNCFSTAGGKDVNVTEKSLIEAKQILAKRDNFNECKSEHSFKENLLLNQGFTNACGKQLMGFTTPSASLLQVSVNGLKKSREFLEDARESRDGQNMYLLNESQISDNVFNTVPVKLSEKSLNKENEHLDCIGESTQCQNVDLLKYPYFEDYRISKAMDEKASEMSVNRIKGIAVKVNESTNNQCKYFNKIKQNVAYGKSESQLEDWEEGSNCLVKGFTKNFENVGNEFEKSPCITEENRQEMKGALQGLSLTEEGENKVIKNRVSGLAGDITVHPLDMQMFKTAEEKSVTKCIIDKVQYTTNKGVANIKDLKDTCLIYDLLNKSQDNCYDNKSLICNSNMANSTLGKERERFVDVLNVHVTLPNRKNCMNYCNESLKSDNKLFENSKNISINGLVNEMKTMKQYEVSRHEKVDSINCFTDITTRNKSQRHSENSNQILEPLVCNVSLTQEVSESTAALLADELSGFQKNECNDLDSCVQAPCSPVLCHERKKESKKIQSHKSRMSLPSNFTNNQTSVFHGHLSPTLPSVIEIDKTRKKYKRKDINSPKKPLKLTTKFLQANIVAVREKAAEEQKNAIETLKNKAKPCKGSLFQLKESFRGHLVSWKKATKGHPPMAASKLELLQHGVKEDVLLVSAENAVNFKFHVSEFCSLDDPLVCIPVGDNAEVIPNVDNTIGITEVERAFLVSPGIDPALVPEGWIHNHYRWIVWKLASIERSFPYLFAGKCLTLHAVLQQLKYRYDREIDRSQRSALRRILECDDTANKRLTLCVAHISKQEASSEELLKKIPSYDIELTDGWYGIRACIDTEMVALIDRGKVTIGTKLIIYGAELLNCSQGCSPLEEASKSARLRIHTNSTRRACWDTKLGYYYRPGPLSISLASVLPAGGTIGSVTVLVVRVYPVIYMEKSADRTAFHSARIESRKAEEFDNKKQLVMEQIYSQEKAKMLKESSLKYKRICHMKKKELSSITSGEELDVILQGSADPALLQVMMNEDQRRSLAEYQGHKNEKTLLELHERVQKIVEQKKLTRISTPLLKVRCLDISKNREKCAILSIWQPREEVHSLFKEGSVLKLFNVSSSGYRSGELQIKSGRQTCYKLVSNPVCSYPQRVATPFDKVISQPPLFGELDCVGVVVHLCPPTSNTQTLFLADAEMSIIGITFWSSIKDSGWLDVLQRQSIVACSNLQWRSGAAVKWVPSAYATELSLFTQQPRQPHLKDAIVNLKEKIAMDINNFTDNCEKTVLSRLNDPNMTPQMMANLHHVSKTPSDTTKSALHFRDSVEATPISRQPSDMVNRRLFRLEHYGDPPLLSPLHLCVQKNVTKEFKTPTRNLQAITPIHPLSQEKGSH